MPARPNTIDMALDEVIQQNRSTDRRQRSQRGQRGSSRRITPSHRSYSSTRDQSRRPSPQPRVFTVRNERASEGPTTLVVSNLFHEVSQEDLVELFSKIGRVKSVKIHYDRAGRSNGVADVAFFNRRDALVASDRFHHMPLDGYPMQIEIQSSSHPSPQVPPYTQSRFNNRGRVHKGGPSSSSWDHRRYRPSRPQPTASRTEPDASTLNADLDNYMMQQ